MYKMTNEEIIKEMQSVSLLNKVRIKLSSFYANMETSYNQRTIPSIFEIRQMEFDTASEIIEIIRKEIEDEYNSLKKNDNNNGVLPRAIVETSDTAKGA